MAKHGDIFKGDDIIPVEAINQLARDCPHGNETATCPYPACISARGEAIRKVRAMMPDIKLLLEEEQGK